MEQTFFGRYRLTAAYDGGPEEISRSGPAINYKARDLRGSEPVAVQVIPIASVDPTARDLFEERARAALKLDHLNIAKVLAVGVENDSLVLASEYLEGETAESWLATHGPMGADAVLRIGLQVVRALAAAAYHGLTHRAIQPSNMLIVPGQTADGGWPLIKLLNFGLAGQEVHRTDTSVAALAAPISPQFASPEQLVNKPIDFRSEIYSLGATMCFLLTGAVPLAVGGMKARLRVRRLPELRRAPRTLNRLLVHMLRENPQNRPHDPVAFEAEMRECLTKVERRQALRRKFGLPIAGILPRSRNAPARAPSIGRQVALGFLAVAALLLTAAVVAAFLLPADSVPFLRQKSGATLVGVPDNTTRTANSSPIATTSPVSAAAPSAPPVITQATQPPSATDAMNSPAPAATASPVQIASVNQSTTSEPVAPAEGPTTTIKTNAPPPAPVSAPSSATVAEDSSEKADQPTEEATPAIATRKPSIASASRKTTTTTRRTRIVQTQPPRSDDDSMARPLPRGQLRARVVGMTPDGRLVLRLPSGRIVTAYPGQHTERVVPSRRVIQRQPAPDTEAPAERSGPYQPFNPDYPLGD